MTKILNMESTTLIRLSILACLLPFYHTLEIESTQWTTTTWPSTVTSTTLVTISEPDKVSAEKNTCRIPTTIDKCADISEFCNFKVLKYTDDLNENSRASVTCRQHYRLNIEYKNDPFLYNQKSTYAYCKCKDNQCKWVFNKGDVKCSFCPAETVQARYGRKLQTIEWAAGIALYFPITIDKRSSNWNIALDFGESNEREKRDVEPHINLADDIIYTPCQAEKMKADGHRIPDTHIQPVDNDQWCNVNVIQGRALANVNMWNQEENYNAELDMWEIPYFYDNEQYWSNAIKAQIDSKLAEFEEKTCVRMVKVDDENRHGGRQFTSAIKITNAGPFCASHVGRVSTEQKLYLGTSCQNGIIPQHEFMHALGYWHEQQRPDREEHIQIHRERCYLTDKQFDVNFGSIGSKWNRNLDNEYDLHSIMHYSPQSCKKINGKPVITHPNGTEFEWQEPTGLSKLDIEGINKAYPCQKKVPPPEVNPTVVYSGNLKLTGISKQRRLWTFSPNHPSLDTSNWTEDKKLNFIVYFENLSKEEIKKAKSASLLYFRYQMPNDDASCLVDQFSENPL